MVQQTSYTNIQTLLGVAMRVPYNNTVRIKRVRNLRVINHTLCKMLLPEVKANTEVTTFDGSQPHAPILTAAH